MKRDTLSIATGGARTRQACELMNMPGWNLFGRIGAMSHILDAGGPLDAPNILPAGSCNSTDWRDARGNALPYQSETRREA